MTGSQSEFLTPSTLVAAATALGCTLILLFGVYLQSLVHINHDVAWIAHSAGWLLDGKRFGSDILDPNPPVAWFLMLPAAAAARSGILPEILAVQAWNWALTVAALALATAVLVPMARILGRIQVIGLLVTTVAVSAILPIGNFGQRDVFAFLFILPYLFSMIGGAVGATATGRVLRNLIGFAAGVGLCLKPFLVAVPILLELLQLLFTRNFRALIRAETVVMAMTVMACAAAILLFAGDYLDFALPLIRAVYWAYDDPGRMLMERFRDSNLPAAYALGIALVTFSFNRTHAVLVAILAGCSISFWVQGKGFPYHAYPMLGTSCLLLVYSSIEGCQSVWRSAYLKRPLFRVAVIGVLLVVAWPPLREPFWQAQQWYRTADREDGAGGRRRDAVIDRLRLLGVGPRDYLYALSTHPNPGFPTVNYLGAQWSGRAVAQFAIPAQVRRSEVKNAEILAAIDRAVTWQVATVVDDLKRHAPSYVMVEARQWRLGLAYRKFDDLAFYGRDPEFARLWHCYVEIEPVDQIRLFQRREGCQPG